MNENSFFFKDAGFKKFSDSIKETEDFREIWVKI